MQFTPQKLFLAGDVPTNGCFGRGRYVQNKKITFLFGVFSSPNFGDVQQQNPLFDGESHGAGSGSPQREGCGPPTVVSLHLRNLNQ